MVLNVHRNPTRFIRDGEMGGDGGWGRGRLYAYRYAVTIRMNPADAQR